MTPSLFVALSVNIVLNIAQALLCTFRWRLLATNCANIPGFGKSFAAYMDGKFFNQALPSIIGGDAVRVMRWRAFHVRVSEAVLSVLRDRIFGAIGAAFLALIACALLWNQPIERYKVLSLSALSIAVILGCAMALTLSQWPRFSALFIRIRSLYALALRLVAKPLTRSQIWASLAIAIAAQLLPGLGVFFLVTALAIDISLVLAVSVTGAILLISMIPISLAGWGVREAGFLAILVPLGVAGEKALMLGICFGMAGLCAALLGGVSLGLGLSLPARSYATEERDGEIKKFGMNI
jgi:uncharacterized membrane protein YbhN (UPF0104 family)